MAEPVETEPLHEVAVDVDLAIINFKDFCPNSGRPQVVLNNDRPEPCRPARSPPGGENVIVVPRVCRLRTPGLEQLRKDWMERHG